MKNVLIIGLLTLSLTGCSLFDQNKKSDQPKQNTQNANNQTNEIVSAMQSGKKMQCTYTDNSQKSAVTSTVFIDGAKFKTIMNIDGKEAYSMFDGNTNYSWGMVEEQGFKITKDCMQTMQTETQSPEAPSQANTDQFMQADDFYEAFNVKCSPINNIDFSLPTNIKFIDACETINAMSQNAEDAMKSLGNSQPPQNSQENNNE